MQNLLNNCIRDRPFNLKGRGVMVFCFVQNFYFGQHESQNIYLFLSRKARIIFPEFHVRLYDKNSESDYFFFPPPKSEYFFQQHWESEYFFRFATSGCPFGVYAIFVNKMLLLSAMLNSLKNYILDQIQTEHTWQ